MTSPFPQTIPPDAPLLRAARLALSVTPAGLLGEAADLVMIAAHPGDAALCCGALLHAAARGGIGLRAIFLTDGPDPGPSRREETAAALGFLAPQASLHWIGEPAGDLPARGRHFDGLARRVAPLIPQGAQLLLPWRGEAGADHRRAHDLACAALAEDVACTAYPVRGRWEAGLPLPHGLRVLTAPPMSQAAKRRTLAAPGALPPDLPPGLREHFALHPELYILD